MVFHRAKIKAVGLLVIMQRNVVEYVTRTKFLGVIIDNKLKWNDHITYVKSKISKTIGLFYKMRQYLERKALVNLYYSLVFHISSTVMRYRVMLLLFILIQL